MIIFETSYIMKTNQQKWTTEQILDQSGKIVIVTGANSGIGYEASAAMAHKGAKVILACRSQDKGKAAVAKIEEQDPKGEVILMQLDLADLGSVARFADDILSEYEGLDILINNAGVMAIPYQQTADGFEMQFGTNHLGHFALTGRLLPLLQKTSGSRVVTVSSYAHIIGKINFDDINSEKSYQKWLAYGQSKLANILFAYELQRRTAKNGNNPISIAVHPGYAATNLQRSSSFFSFANKFIAQSQEMGALPTLYAATHPDIRGGEYVGPDGFFEQRGYPHITRSSSRSYDQRTARRLWQVSEELTGVRFGF
jgi:NAD(P)-dependent dehydrogenase (short-subunit alcohol dehydrogenase family)